MMTVRNIRELNAMLGLLPRAVHNSLVGSNCVLNSVGIQWPNTLLRLSLQDIYLPAEALAFLSTYLGSLSIIEFKDILIMHHLRL